MNAERRAAVQRSVRYGKEAGTIAWWEHETAWLVYAGRYGYNQSAVRIHERGGFDYGELVDQLGHEPTTWLSRHQVVPIEEQQT